MISYNMLNTDYPCSLEHFFVTFNKLTKYISLHERYGLSDKQHNMYDERHLDFMARLEPYIFQQVIAKEWFGYVKVPEHTQSLKINIYINSDEIQNIILSYVQDLFWRYEAEEWLTLPQDICLFRTDKSIVLGTVSHEGIAKIFLNDDEIIPIPYGFEKGKKGLVSTDCFSFCQ